MWKLLSVFVSAVGLAACAVPTKQNFDRRLQATVGQDINGAIRSFGPPQNVYQMPNGNQLYTWVMGESRRTPMVTEAEVSGGYGYASGTATTTGGDRVVSYCRLQFEVGPDQRVISFRSDGDRCRSR